MGDSENSAPQHRMPLAVSVKALFLQCLWNNKTLQGPGFAWAVSASSGADRGALAARHMRFFNTTPALAPCLVAAVARLEADGAEESEVAKLKESASGPLAAAGDQLFWATLRPLAALAGLVGSAVGPGFAVFLAVAAYNIPQVFFRAFGAARGYKAGGEGVAACIGVAKGFTGVGRLVASILVGLLAGAVIQYSGDRIGGGGGLIAIGAAAALGYLLIRRRVALDRICVALIVLAGLLSLVPGG